MKKLLFLLGLGAMLIPAASLAAYFKADSNVFATPSKTLQDNAYIVGGNVTVPGKINGDLFAAGSMIFISAEVTQDIALIGGTVNVSGASGEDIRVGGGNVTIGGNFSGELMVAGGQVVVSPETQIKKDSYIAAGGITFSGKEVGNLTITAGTIFINGTIEKNLKIKNAKKVTIGEDAMIKGNLEYSAPSEAVIESGAQILGATTFHKIEKAGISEKSGAVFGGLFGLFTLMSLAKVLMILTAVYLLWYIWKKDSVDFLRMVKSHFGRSLLRGFIFIVAVPVAAVIALVSIVGVLPGLFAISIYAALLILSVPFAALFTASLLTRNWTNLRWFHILLGAAAIMVVKIIPFIGCLAVFIVYLAALGALLSVLKSKFHRST
jgi:cytoskeletal protein CcmA (bactofilin family)